MNRRGFLGFFGAAAAVGPSTAAKMTSDLASLDLTRVGLADALTQVEDGYLFTGEESPKGRIEWALKKLAKRKLMSAVELDRQRRDFDVHRLDPNIASLRSMSVVSKMRVTRDQLWKKSHEKEYEWLLRLAAGEDY